MVGVNSENQIPRPSVSKRQRCSRLRLGALALVSGIERPKMKTKTFPKLTKRDIGCIIDCSCDSADTLNERTIELAAQYGFDAGEPIEDNEDKSQILSELGDNAVAFLNEQELPSYCSFFFDDNSLFLAPCIENAREDVGFVSGQKEDADPEDSDYPNADYRGEWLHVSDHGNATLYCRGEDGKDIEIWSVV